VGAVSAPTPVGEPDPRVVALAREVERLTRRHTDLGQGLADLDGLVRRMAEDLALLLPTAEDENPPALSSWLAAADPEQAPAVLTDLAEWLGAVYLRHPDAALPSCWAWHPAAVEELWWLRQAHHGAYHGPGACWREVGDWHDRQRPGVTRRLNAALGACDLARHTPGGGPRPAATGGSARGAPRPARRALDHPPRHPRPHRPTAHRRRRPRPHPPQDPPMSAVPQQHRQETRMQPEDDHDTVRDEWATAEGITGSRFIRQGADYVRRRVPDTDTTAEHLDGGCRGGQRGHPCGPTETGDADHDRGEDRGDGQVSGENAHLGEESGDEGGVKGPVWEREAVSASWAVAARDAAVERGEWDAAARFSAQAREAIRGALAAGASIDELAEELDYPGGAARLDGEHIDRLITQHQPGREVPARRVLPGRPTASDTAATAPADSVAPARNTDSDGPTITVDASGFDSTARLTAIGEARDVGDTALPHRLQDHEWAAPEISFTPREQSTRSGHEHAPADSDAPGWIPERANHTPDAATRATAEPAARVAALREQLTARGGDGSQDADGGQARREQLNRWHHDDLGCHDTTSDGHDHDGSGWSR